MKKINVGNITLDCKVDVTDPCYNKDVWCRTTVDDMRPGEYECFAIIPDDADENGEYPHVSASCICHKDFVDELDELLEDGGSYIDTIGVDAGLAGYYQDKPDFTDEEWTDFCDLIKNKSWMMHDLGNGFVTRSGYGDGGYDVTGIYDENHNFCFLMINFSLD